ncbi:AraC family transcriptional regulator [Ramlibacter solisilvae]|uniref:AraC family transcriptional regulator n=1 Tax=Ramlibacter tataouinensis TaxID=94132 RepID=UPI0009EF5601|nr:AraC family transcriptional regulator [Ramlibacter tataouinensis]
MAARPAPDSIPIGTLSGITGVLETLGHDGTALLRRFGIDQRALRDPLAPSSIRLHGRVLLAAIELTGIEHLPLLVGERSQLGNVGPVRALAMNAGTARKALKDLMHYASIWYRGVNLTLEHDQGYAVLGYAAGTEFPGRDALLTAYLAGGIKNLRMILGPDWKASLVRVAHRRPGNLEPFAKLFRVPVLFDQPRHEILFPETDLDRPLGRTDAQLEAFLKRELDALEASVPADFTGQVRRAVESQLLRGNCSNERIASMFGVRRQTLHRQLAEQETTYSAILEESRRRLAAQLLVGTDMSMAEVAAMLGYGTQGNFTRAFIRWFGSTPSAWKRIHHKMARSA